MSEVNIPLLRKAVEWVEEQAQLPDDECQWVQSEWTAVRIGNRILDPEFDAGDYTREELLAIAQRGECETTYCVAGYIGVMLSDAYKYTWAPKNQPHVDVFAARALGISENDKWRLFNATNSAEDVRRIAEEIAGQPL